MPGKTIGKEDPACVTVESKVVFLPIIILGTCATKGEIDGETLIGMGSGPFITCFVDAAYDSVHPRCKSISGISILLPTLQSQTALSPTEAEFYAAVSAAKLENDVSALESWHFAVAIIVWAYSERIDNNQDTTFPHLLLSFSTATTTTEKIDEDFSKFSITELKQMATKSLRQYQREDEGSVPPARRAENILQHILERTTQQQPDDGEAEDFSNVQTSLIDTWTTYQSSVMRDIKYSIVEESSEEGTDESTNQQRKRLQYKNLRMICSAAESMTSILESMENPSPHHYVVILKAWANACKVAHKMKKSKTADVVGIPQRAQLILNGMGGSSNASDVVPVEAYNEVIKAWAYSKEYLRGTMAEQVFRRIKFPTGESLRMTMRAHALSKETRSAFQATGHFMRMMKLLEAGREDMEPTSIFDYHILCNAWTVAGDRNSSSKVYNVLQIMNNAYRKGHTEICPDLRCYRDALITMSRRQNIDDVGELADSTLKEMREQMIFPDTMCYRSAILAWKHVAMSRDCLNPEQAIRRTHELLLEMTEAYHRTTQTLIQPTTEDYNHVLHAMTISKNPKIMDHALGLFKTLEEEASVTGGADPQSYRYMLGNWRNSRSPNKVAHASLLLQDIKDNYVSNDSWRDSKMSKAFTMDALNAFVRVCGAHTTPSKKMTKELQQERTRTMTLALHVLKDARELGLTPNSDTYTALVEACDNLLPANGVERENVLENIFRRACEGGVVNPSLLEHFKSAASTHLYARLVVSKSIPTEDIKIVPKSWTENIKGYREGRKGMPLSIHGNFTLTKAAAEYRMRNLRRRKNQKVLRGGRLK
eukprot:jgi/Psemu1/68647/estExt_Genemark1.C_5570023